MNKGYRVLENNDFLRTIKTGHKLYSDFFNIYYLENNLIKSRYGISVSKKVGNAVTRNKIKRQIRSIIDLNKKNYQYNKDYIIIVKKDYLKTTFENIKISLNELIEKSNK